MIKFVYKKGGAFATEVFDRTLDMIEFVALNRIKDEDFISMSEIDRETGEEDAESKIVGIDGLAEAALKRVADTRAREAEIQAMLDAQDEDNFDDEDEE